MHKWAVLLAGCLLLAGCGTAPAPGPGTASPEAGAVLATPETAAPGTATPEQVLTQTLGAVKTRRLTVALNGCIAFEAASAGGSLKTAIAASDLVVYLAGDFVPDDLAGETSAWQQGLSREDQATLTDNWPGVYRCARGICEDTEAQQGLLDDAGVTTDFSAMDLSEVPARLDRMNEALTG